MFTYLGKILVTAVTVLLVTELAKKNMALAAILASLPIVSILSMIIMHGEANDVTRIVAFCHEIVWLVLPSITLFIMLPVLIQLGLSFYVALVISMASTVASYFLFGFLRTLAASFS